VPEASAALEQSTAWRDLADPGQVRSQWDDPENNTVFVPCGQRWDALIVTSLDRGLHALDILQLPTGGDSPVLGDYVRRELILLVPPGTGHRCTATGTRVLTTGSWLVMPAKPGTSVAVATWLGTRGGRRLLDVRQIQQALSQIP
jgi:hypothetical protein